MPPAFLALLLALALLALIPTRRLFVRGARTATLSAYYLLVLLTTLAVTLAPARGRLLVPIVLLLYVAPFVTFRNGLDRLLGRRRAEVRPPPRNVTPQHEQRDAEPARPAGR